MRTMAMPHNIHLVDGALERLRGYLLRSQQPDGTWAGPVETDPRATAFYLNTVWKLGQHHDDATREMERYLWSEQLECGAWQAWPGGGPDMDVTAVCTLTLENAATERGRQARSLGQRWLSAQPLPEVDSFWKGFLALNGDLDWEDLPYLSPRLVSNPDWLHPNVYDFSFLRIAIVSAALLQTHTMQARAKWPRADTGPMDSGQQSFADWKGRWIAKARKPMRGLLPFLCRVSRSVDHMLPITKHRKAAIDWLLMHQEDDGSFFSAVHMTSIAVLTLHHLDAAGYQKQIKAGLDAMRKWQTKDNRGRWQQFTDATTWDTILFMDLLRRLDVPSSNLQIQRARDYTISSQNMTLGDCSHRMRNPSAGGWGFQRVGKWYPDSDDTVMAVSTLLELEDNPPREVITKGLGWILAMQSSNGGWASWDRNDRSWMRYPDGGRWFARDLPATEITARIVVLLSRLVRGKYRGFDDLVPAARSALHRAARWLKSNNQNGFWFGTWFTHYLYGTCHALEAYRELGYSHDEPEIQAALSWLISVANADGGFGEAPDSATQKKFVNAASTPFHTACALLALVHAQAAHHPVAQRAVAWLLDNQNAAGNWTNRDYFAAGVPGLWYANFSLTPTYFAGKSLILFRKSQASSDARAGP
jgi:squalene-hopene/tetraprenyl-beta-curcumene cyclase